MPRETLARLLVGDIIDLAAPGTPTGFELMATAQSEGVLALMGHRVSQLHNACEDVLAELAAAARALAASSLMRQAEARRVLSELPPSIPVLVLKGTALALWLYPQPYLRESSDVDLLFENRDDAERAAALLEVRDYAVPYRPSELAHEFLCRREKGLVVDLDMHWKLSGEPLFWSTFTFSELRYSSVSLPSLAATARGLGPIQAFAHACIHRASNISSGIGDRLKWLYDIHLLMEGFSPVEWRRLEALCRSTRICGVVSEATSATSAAFRTRCPVQFANAMADGRRTESFDASRLNDWQYMQGQNLMALPGWVARARWVWHRAFPTSGYLQELYGQKLTPAVLWGTRLLRMCTRVRPGTRGKR